MMNALFACHLGRNKGKVLFQKTSEIYKFGCIVWTWLLFLAALEGIHMKPRLVCVCK